jgi:hypothetical protein
MPTKEIIHRLRTWTFGEGRERWLNLNQKVFWASFNTKIGQLVHWAKPDVIFCEDASADFVTLDDSSVTCEDCKSLHGIWLLQQLKK